MNNLLKRSVFPAVKMMKKVKIKISCVPSENILFRPNKSDFQVPYAFGQLLRNTPNIYFTFFILSPPPTRVAVMVMWLQSP